MYVYFLKHNNKVKSTFIDATNHVYVYRWDPDHY